MQRVSLICDGVSGGVVVYGNGLWVCIQCEDFVDLLRAGRMCCMELVGCLIDWLVGQSASQLTSQPVNQSASQYFSQSV